MKTLRAIALLAITMMALGMFGWLAGYFIVEFIKLVMEILIVGVGG